MLLSFWTQRVSQDVILLCACLVVDLSKETELQSRPWTTQEQWFEELWRCINTKLVNGKGMIPFLEKKCDCHYYCLFKSPAVSSQFVQMYSISVVCFVSFSDTWYIIFFKTPKWWWLLVCDEWTRKLYFKRKNSLCVLYVRVKSGRSIVNYMLL